MAGILEYELTRLRTTCNVMVMTPKNGTNELFARENLLSSAVLFHLLDVACKAMNTEYER